MNGTILVVDDQPGTRRFVRNVLERDGYGVVEAADEPSAWDAVHGAEEPVALALIDVDLPGLGGRYVAEHIQMLGRVPVLFMSGHDRDTLVTRGELAAGAAFVPKPFSIGSLRQAISRNLHAAEAADVAGTAPLQCA